MTLLLPSPFFFFAEFALKRFVQNIDGPSYLPSHHFHMSRDPAFAFRGPTFLAWPGAMKMGGGWRASASVGETNSPLRQLAAGFVIRPRWVITLTCPPLLP